MSKEEFNASVEKLVEEMFEEREDHAKECIHWEICRGLHKTYKAKNADYGDSFARVRRKYPNAILIRLNDKLNRLESLESGQCSKVPDESIEDTLLDLANYCIMELVEREMERREHADTENL